MPIQSTTHAATSSKKSTTSGGMLGLGSKGPKVVELQKALAAAGFNPHGFDGVFGPKTLAALRAFQKSAGIVVDGRAGPQTWGALAAATKKPSTTPAPQAGPPTLKEGAKGDHVLWMQTLLAQKGYAVGPLDGKFGKVTKAAVSAFQKANGLPGSGTVGPLTWALLSKPGGAAPSTPTTPTTAPTGPVPQNIAGMLDWAKSMLGTKYAAVNPFRFGEVLWDGKQHGSVNGSGSTYTYPKGTRVFDCSGFVVTAYRKLGVDLEKHGMASSGAFHTNAQGFLQDVKSADQLKAGDLIVYKPKDGVGHVVIYLGNGKCIEAAGGVGVVIRDVKWDRVRSMRRVPLP